MMLKVLMGVLIAMTILLIYASYTILHPPRHSEYNLLNHKAGSRIVEIQNR